MLQANADRTAHRNIYGAERDWLLIGGIEPHIIIRLIDMFDMFDDLITVSNALGFHIYVFQVPGMGENQILCCTLESYNSASSILTLLSQIDSSAELSLRKQPTNTVIRYGVMKNDQDTQNQRKQRLTGHYQEKHSSSEECQFQQQSKKAGYGNGRLIGIP